MIESSDVGAQLVAGFAALGGWLVLRHLCPVKDRASTHAMLLLCTVGMLAGLAIDADEGRLATLVALCVRGDRSLFYWVQMHWEQLPAMHVGMVLGSVVILPLWNLRGGIGRGGTRALGHIGLRMHVRETAQNVGCSAVMLLGMNVGLMAHPFNATSVPSTSTMLAMMVAGMVWGLVLSALATRISKARLTDAMRRVDQPRCAAPVKLWERAVPHPQAPPSLLCSHHAR